MLARLGRVPAFSSPRRCLSVVAGNTVVTESGKKLHPMWLRERCMGPNSVQWETAQPLHQPHDFPADLDVTLARLRPAAGGWTAQLKVVFSDGVISTFDADALDAEADDFGSYGQQWFDVRLPERHLWDASSGIPVPRVQFAELDSRRQSALFDMTTKLLRDGHVIIEGVPCEEGQILQVAKIISGFPGEKVVRPTNWGAVFNVRSNPDGTKKDLAYTSVRLPPHVDNPYRDPNPGFQLLHAVENECSPGNGENFAVDGFAVAEKLRAEEPEYFEVLSSVECRWENDGGDRSAALVHMAPQISVNQVLGKVVQVRYSPKSGGYAPALADYEKMVTLFRARRRLAEMMNDEVNAVHFRLDAGCLWIFNNLRVLHGRGEFDPSEGRRFLQGAYVDMDSVTSAYFRSKEACDAPRFVRKSSSSKGRVMAMTM